jgi:hypothetical protein
VNLAVSQCPSTQIVLSGYRFVSSLPSASLRMTRILIPLFLQPRRAGRPSRRETDFFCCCLPGLRRRILRRPG